jgi:hypothetical protein
VPTRLASSGKSPSDRFSRLGLKRKRPALACLNRSQVSVTVQGWIWLVFDRLTDCVQDVKKVARMTNFSELPHLR